ncbi:putative methyltransferase [Mobilicoccus pelagius NBRC 104925]|uniref:Putative methyltransferase n=1 Tax=Mobilicoccus pelagius NBRC 104925 TaxID=1089455 RepID=H5UW65_9MICO|nr:putative methyltransferase [Mobilicoccus pelagius NBRC 104925]
MTAVDVSRVAVDRGRARAERLGLTVDRQVADVAQVEGRFDLVIAFCPVLHTDSGVWEHVLDRVAPGGTLLFVHHLDVDRERARAHGFDPDALVAPADVPATVGAGWRIEVDEAVDREVIEGAGAHDHRDGIVRARFL